MTYGLKEYKELLERQIKKLDDPMECPWDCDPYSQTSINIRRAKQEALTYAIEMLPDIKEPMKDHEFRECVNDLRELVLEYGKASQLRSRLSTFLQEFKNKC